MRLPNITSWLYDLDKKIESTFWMYFLLFSLDMDLCAFFFFVLLFTSSKISPRIQHLFVWFSCKLYVYSLWSCIAILYYHNNIFNHPFVITFPSIISNLATALNVSPVRYLTEVPWQLPSAWWSEESFELGFAKMNALFEHHLYIIYKPSSMRGNRSECQGRKHTGEASDVTFIHCKSTARAEECRPQCRDPIST